MKEMPRRIGALADVVSRCIHMGTVVLVHEDLEHDSGIVSAACRHVVVAAMGRKEGNSLLEHMAEIAYPEARHQLGQRGDLRRRSWTLFRFLAHTGHKVPPPSVTSASLRSC